MREGFWHERVSLPRWVYWVVTFALLLNALEAVAAWLLWS